jgi:ABC-type phosphate transport system substrate-binding protein
MAISRGTTRTRLGAAAVLGVLLCTNAWAGDVVIVANPITATPTLTKDDIQAIYTGRKTRWNSGGTIVPVLLEEDSIHSSFLSAYIQKTPAQFDTWWKKLVFTGKASPLRSMKTEREVVAFVSRTEGAIGYVSRGAASDSVRIIEIQ